MSRLAATASNQLARLDYRSIFEAVPGLREGSLLAVVIATFYFLVLPLLNCWPDWRVAQMRLDNVMSGLLNPKSRRFDIIPNVHPYDFDLKTPQFWVTAVMVMWFVAGLSVLLLAASGRIDGARLATVLRIWFWPLVAILSLAPFSLVALVLVLIGPVRVRPTSRANVVYGLLAILCNWPDVADVGSIRWSFDRWAASRIRSVASDVRHLGSAAVLGKGKSEEWTARQFSLAADNLLVCRSWLTLPRADTLEAVRLQVIGFCNPFLTGNLHDLPRQEVPESSGLAEVRPRQRVIKTTLHILAALAYGAAPFLVFIILRDQLAPFSAAPDTLWVLLYTLWIAVGLYGYLEHTSQNSGEVIAELIKSFLGRS